ncbi:adenylate cyclase [Dehalobacter sp. TBBPA1]|uniref:CYTH domain-containing protein n=1 Tax=Dehalobacter sp. TBBPA1 TaxID=3235037 RepID=UPI0034A3A027
MALVWELGIVGLEIERKYLVHQHLLPELKEGERMIQGYLSEKPSVRFRIKGNKMVLTIKDYYTKNRRFELETPVKEITEEEIQKLISLAISPPIIKTRYLVKSRQGLIWEIDVYEEENAGLITVDIEIPQEDFPLEFPEWVAGDCEITGEKRYTNLNLGRKPFATWAE